jgi:hypothetical protein
MKGRTGILAAAAASLFLAGAAGYATPAGAEGNKVKCEGVNSCKGKSDCKTATSACAGKNGCAGKGFVMLTQAECDAAKAKLKAGDEE